MSNYGHMVESFITESEPEALGRDRVSNRLVRLNWANLIVLDVPVDDRNRDIASLVCLRLRKPEIRVKISVPFGPSLRICLDPKLFQSL